jgi:hypothetical protein
LWFTIGQFLRARIGEGSHVFARFHGCAHCPVQGLQFVGQRHAEAGFRRGEFYCAPDGARALIDRELYLPAKWTEDRQRCRAAGIGGEVPFATKPRLAKKMLARAVKAGVPFRWAAGDEVYGSNPELREWLESEKKGYVAAGRPTPANRTTPAASEITECCCSTNGASPQPVEAWLRVRWAERAPAGS